MMSTLADYVRTRREALGLNQTQLAERSGLPRTTINRIESGTTKLPTPEFRRKLAAGLGVSHIDLLIAAGELLPEEVQTAGVEGVVSSSVRHPADAIHDVVDWFDWTDEQAESARMSLLSLQPAGRRLMAVMASQYFTGTQKFSDLSEEEQDVLRQADPDHLFHDEDVFYVMEDDQEPDPLLAHPIPDDLQPLVRRMFERSDRRVS
jgi:transcriptional regulator with XRE-family HTH domain